MHDKKLIEEIVENIVKALKKAGFRVEILTYPQNQRSIDITGARDDLRIVIKTVIDARNVSNVEVKDLERAQQAYKTSSLIVAEKHGKNELEADVIYKRMNVNVIRCDTLEQVLLKDEKVYVYKSHGVYSVRISPEKFRKRRIELGYSLGEAADLIGVTRKAVYDYEHKRTSVSIETALRIAEIFGEDVLEPLEILKPEITRTMEDAPTNKLEEEVHLIAKECGHRFYRFMRTPIDFALSSNNNVVSITLKTRNTRAYWLKVRESERLSRIIDSEHIIIENRDDIRKLKERLELNKQQ